MLGFLFLSYPAAAIAATAARSWGRCDHEPVPQWVDRAARIEAVDGQYVFVLERNDELQLIAPWDEVERFEVVDYWSMFGDAGKSPHNTGWHAIIVTPSIGRPWLVASTIEAKAPLREKFSVLDARFGAAARAAFMRQLKAPPSGGQSPAVDASDGVPSKL